MASEEELDIAASEGFIDLEDRILFTQLQIAEEMKSFLNTRPGKYLLGRCKHIVRDFCDVAMDIGDKSMAEHNQLRLRANAARMVMELIHEAISEGHTAELQLRQRDAEDT